MGTMKFFSPVIHIIILEMFFAQECVFVNGIAPHHFQLSHLAISKIPVEQIPYEYLKPSMK